MYKWVKNVKSDIQCFFFIKSDLPTGGKWSPKITVPEGGPKPRIWAGGRRSPKMTNEDRFSVLEWYVPEGDPKPRIWAGSRRSPEITNEDRVHHVEGPWNISTCNQPSCTQKCQAQTLTTNAQLHNFIIHNEITPPRVNAHKHTIISSLIQLQSRTIDPDETKWKDSSLN